MRKMIKPHYLNHVQNDKGERDKGIIQHKHEEWHLSQGQKGEAIAIQNVSGNVVGNDECAQADTDQKHAVKAHPAQVFGLQKEVRNPKSTAETIGDGKEKHEPKDEDGFVVPHLYHHQLDGQGKIYAFEFFLDLLHRLARGWSILKDNEKPRKSCGKISSIFALDLAYHVFRDNIPVKLLAGQQPQANGGFTQGGAFFVGLLGDSGSIVIPDVGIECGHQHE